MPVADRLPAADAAPVLDLTGSRILVVMPSIPVLGMERANLQIMKLMQDRGADVLFVVNAVRGEKVRNAVEGMGMRCVTAPVTELPRLPRAPRDVVALPSAWLKSARAIARIVRDFQPTHVHVTNRDYLFFAAPALARARCRVVLRQPNAASRQMGRVRQVLSDALWTRVVEPLCDLVVCNSRFSAAALRAAGVQERKIVVINNCVPDAPSRRRGDAPALERAHFNIVFVGQLSPPKGIDVLLDASRALVAEYAEIRFHLAGWRSPYVERLAEQVDALGLSAQVRFVGEIDDVPGLLAQADLHVCPSICEESFPNVVLEAKSRGVPSVVFPSGGIPELVSHRVDGYVCEGKTAAALRDGILYFLRDRNALREAGEAARSSLTRFSSERIAAEWAAVFRAAAHDVR